MTTAGTGMVVRQLREPTQAWDEYSARADGGTIYHQSGWARLIADVMGHETRFIVAQDGTGAWQGVLPLTHVRSRLFGSHLVSMPFLNAGGPLGDPIVRAELATAALREAERLNVDSLELRATAPLECAIPPNHRRITVLLDLPETEEELWGRLHTKLRANVRRAGREGVELRYGPDQIGGFYEVFARNMRDLGTPVLPLEFFERIAATFPQDVIYACAYWNGQPIAGQCSFVWGDELEMVWGSSLREFNNLKVTTLIHWEFMKQGIERGLRVFNFGRCSPGSGTHQFKQRWGGVDAPLPWLASVRGGGRAPASAQSPAYRRAIAAWQRLPVAVANRLGPPLARRLP